MLSAQFIRSNIAFDTDRLCELGIIDHSLEARRLQKNLMALVQTNSTLSISHAPSPVVEMAGLDGWRDTELVILQVRLARQEIHLVTAPHAVWRQHISRLVKLKTRAGHKGLKVVLVAPAYIQREPRMSNVRMLEDAWHIHVTAEDRMAVFVHILDNGGYSTLQDCAEVMSSTDTPFSCVLSMVSMGLLEMDLNKPFKPEARVDLPEVGA